MSKVIGIINFVPLIFATFFLIYFIRFQQNELVSFDEWVLEKQANYAADSAVEAMLANSPDIDISYQSGDYIKVDPNVGVRDYSEILALSFGMPSNDQTVNHMQSKYIKALAVCAYDGIYAFWTPQQVDTHGIALLTGTPKIPYFYTQNGEQYQLNLNYKSGARYYNNAGHMTTHYYEGVESDSLTDIVSEARQKVAINSQVGDVFNYALHQAYADKGMGARENYALPDVVSDIKGSMPVQSVTIIGLTEGHRRSAFTPITAESIGGARIIDNDPILGCCVYMNGSAGQAFHAYVRESDVKKYAEEGEGGAAFKIFGYNVAQVDEVFDNVFDAATGRNSSGRGKNLPEDAVYTWRYVDLVTRFRYKED